MSETITIEDCYYYAENPSACSNCNIPLPPAAIISYDMVKPSVYDMEGHVSLKLSDGTYTYFVGNWQQNTVNGILINRGSANLVHVKASGITANEKHTLGVSYNNGDWTYFKDDEVKPFTGNYTPTVLTDIFIEKGTMENLKIIPL